MAKLTTSDLVNLQNETTAVNTINNNFAAVETALENTLSRDGTTPNEMESDLDMNSHAILNLPAPNDPTSPLRVQDIEDYIDQINGTGSGVVSSPGAGEVNRIAKAVSTGVVGFGQVEIDGSHNIHPTTTDTPSLGTLTKRWLNLFLAGGGVINFNNSNYTITHSAGNLAFSGTTSTAGIASFAAGVRPTISGTGTIGSGTLMFDSLFLKSGGVINFNNSDYTLTHSAGLLTSSGPFSTTYLEVDEQTAPSTPASGNYRLYAKTDSLLYGLNDAGTETLLSLPVATQSDLETATSLVTAVTPGRQHYHPGMAKFWVKATNAGVATVSYNVTSVTDDGTGLITVTIATDFSSADWACFAHTERTSTSLTVAAGTQTQTNVRFNTQAAGTVQIEAYDHVATTNTLEDPQAWHIMGFGDQA